MLEEKSCDFVSPDNTSSMLAATIYITPRYKKALSVYGNGL